MGEDGLFDSIPPEISQHLVNFSEALQATWDIVENFKNGEEGVSTKVSPIDQVQSDLSLTYAMNALFFIYLKCNGIDVKNHPILKELERLTSCLKRCQQLCEKPPPRKHQLDKQATSRFVRHALWQSAQSKTKKRKLGLDKGGEGSS